MFASSTLMGAEVCKENLLRSEIRQINHKQLLYYKSRLTKISLYTYIGEVSVHVSEFVDVVLRLSVHSALIHRYRDLL